MDQKAVWVSLSLLECQQQISLCKANQDVQYHFGSNNNTDIFREYNTTYFHNQLDICYLSVSCTSCATFSRGKAFCPYWRGRKDGSTQYEKKAVCTHPTHVM